MDANVPVLRRVLFNRNEKGSSETVALCSIGQQVHLFPDVADSERDAVQVRLRVGLDDLDITRTDRR